LAPLAKSFPAATSHKGNINAHLLEKPHCVDCIDPLSSNRIRPSCMNSAKDMHHLCMQPSGYRGVNCWENSFCQPCQQQVLDAYLTLPIAILAARRAGLIADLNSHWWTAHYAGGIKSERGPFTSTSTTCSFPTESESMPCTRKGGEGPKSLMPYRVRVQALDNKELLEPLRTMAEFTPARWIQVVSLLLFLHPALVQ
jgi:hypothetical protein